MTPDFIAGMILFGVMLAGSLAVVRQVEAIILTLIERHCARRGK